MKDKSKKYFDNLNGKKVICVDFDNTICVDAWPYIGELVPGSIEVLKALKKNGHRIILNTQRTKNYPICCPELYAFCEDTGSYGDSSETADLISQVVEYCHMLGLTFDDINQNKTWETQTGDNARKVFSDYFIDDHSVGMKFIKMKGFDGKTKMVVDWKYIDKWCLENKLYDVSALK